MRNLGYSLPETDFGDQRESCTLVMARHKALRRCSSSTCGKIRDEQEFLARKPCRALEVQVLAIFNQSKTRTVAVRVVTKWRQRSNVFILQVVRGWGINNIYVKQLTLLDISHPQVVTHQGSSRLCRPGGYPA